MVWQGRLSSENDSSHPDYDNVSCRRLGSSFRGIQVIDFQIEKPSKRGEVKQDSKESGPVIRTEFDKSPFPVLFFTTRWKTKFPAVRVQINILTWSKQTILNLANL